MVWGLGGSKIPGKACIGGGWVGSIAECAYVNIYVCESRETRDRSPNRDNNKAVFSLFLFPFTSYSDFNL